MNGEIDGYSKGCQHKDRHTCIHVAEMNCIPLGEPTAILGETGDIVVYSHLGNSTKLCCRQWGRSHRFKQDDGDWGWEHLDYYASQQKWMFERKRKFGATQIASPFHHPARTPLLFTRRLCAYDMLSSKTIIGRNWCI